MRLLITLFCFVLISSMFGQTPDVMPKKALKKGFPGVVPLEGDYLFIDQTEISNGDWKEFLAWLWSNNQNEYQSMLPDTQC